MRAFNINIKRFMKNRGIHFEEHLEDLPYDEQPKNYREKKKYKEVLEWLKNE